MQMSIKVDFPHDDVEATQQRLQGPGRWNFRHLFLVSGSLVYPEVETSYQPSAIASELLITTN